MKKVLIVSSSLRVGSNSEILAHEAENGARDAGCEVEFITLKDKTINFCRGCLACQNLGKCVLKDDMENLINKVQNADVIIYATPIYYYEMCGQLKTFLDRCNPLFAKENQFKDVYLITTLNDSTPGMSQAAQKGLEGWVACFPQARFAGMLDCGSLGDSKAVINRSDFLQKAYDLGRNV